MKNFSFFFFLVPILVLSGLSWEEQKTKEEKLSPVLNVFNWEDYFGETTLEDFEKKFHVKVNLDTFEDDNIMISSVQSHPEKYDVVITSGDIVKKMEEMRLLSEINLDNIPNLKNIDKQYLNPQYDHGNKHSVPYLWGTTGIVVNRRYIKKEGSKSWGVLWNPAYKGKIAMLNNDGEVIWAALKYLGYSLNTVDGSQLQKASQKLLEQKSLLAGYFDPIIIREKLINNEIWAAQLYSGDAMFAISKNNFLEYIIPQEGAEIWVDCLVIPRDAQHKYTAEVFINYILEPQVSAAIANYLWYANCNKAADIYTSKEILNSACLYPAKENLKKCEFVYPAGGEDGQNNVRQIRNKIWSKLQLQEK